jgi:hypothetical protein
MLLDRILSEIEPGTEIPKPDAHGAFRLKGSGVRREERAVIYTIPNHRDPSRPYEKGITASELEKAHEELVKSGQLTHAWFKSHLPGCAREGRCNFTTIGGLLKLLRLAEYVERGVYQQVSVSI